MIRDVTGDAVVAVAEKDLGETYVLGARAPMGNAAWTGPWDCAEFASWCVHRATGVLYGTQPGDDPIFADAYTGYWVEQALRDGATISIETAARTRGALLVRAAAVSMIGHIAISDGAGGTLEAHSSKRGVTRGDVSGRRWDFGILVPGIRYRMGTEPVVIEAPANVLHVTRPLMHGPLVRRVQRALQARRFSPGKVDGVYGPQTAHAVRMFQAEEGLVADGEVGALTLKVLKIKPPKPARIELPRVKSLRVKSPKVERPPVRSRSSAPRATAARRRLRGRP